ncbi:hypothetical protein BTZ20_1309 [Rhodococcus sp. MTM3W5.2]|nr:hypothetical protein BTZ20_1309 [Rhodococcus sp. MTM3W5.2]
MFFQLVFLASLTTYGWLVGCCNIEGLGFAVADMTQHTLPLAPVDRQGGTTRRHTCF